MEKEQQNINIRMVYSEKFNSALDANPELNDETNYLLNRFLNSDWGNVSEKESEKYNEIINLREGCVIGRYSAQEHNICIELIFEDKTNAILKLKFEEEKQ